MSVPTLPLFLAFLFLAFEPAYAYYDPDSVYYGYQALSGAAIAAIVLGM